MKFWINYDGKQIGAGDSHQTAAMRILPPSIVDRIQAEHGMDDFNDALYSAMFARRYMRISYVGNTIFIDQPDCAKVEYLSRAQRDWVTAKIEDGRTIQFNNRVYVETRQGRSNANEIVSKLIG